MTRSIRNVFSTIACLLVVGASGVTLAQQPRSSSWASSSSAPSTSPETCKVETNKATVASTNPQNKNILSGTLVRETCKNGCITGTLTIPDKSGDKEKDWTCSTLELPWNNNASNKSCIPANKTYRCKRTKSPRFGDTFEVTNVPGSTPDGPRRTHILFHAGNFPENTSGCILLGMEVDQNNHLMRSRAAVAEFMKELEGYNEFLLTVVDKTGTCSSNSSSSVAKK